MSIVTIGIIVAVSVCCILMICYAVKVDMDEQRKEEEEEEEEMKRIESEFQELANRNPTLNQEVIEDFNSQNLESEVEQEASYSKKEMQPVPYNVAYPAGENP
eukprot:CAMPEP_0168618036 /NCGR_PEP_ID=MMETSP0449_2-20121227/5859_1 /TAXON_ID=1082188 /ORGANISM="Strombidium rassoulzadegani, Strain ras09" /LENGTH=102 /DNA_ID=CAMNT_0008658887 /DNA_START=353 /DNA_END=661 /DNA_ORIENTATION=-